MLTITAAIERFLFHCQYERNLSPKTLKAYQTDLQQFRRFSFLEEKVQSMEEVSKEVLRAWLKELSGRLKPKSVKRKLASLKAFLNFLELEDSILVNPIRKMQVRIKVPQKLPVYLTIGEVDAIFEAARKDLTLARQESGMRDREVVRDISVLELLFASGIRVSELCQLRKANVRLKEGTILVQGKGNRERKIHIGHWGTLASLYQYSSLFKIYSSPTPYFFLNRRNSALSPQSVRNMVRRYGKAAGISKPITPHVFRHTFATLLLEEGVDLKYIQHFLGHSSITTTQIYTHVSSRKEAEVLLAKHPRGRM